jgi:hypothetical protein
MSLLIAYYLTAGVPTASPSVQASAREETSLFAIAAARPCLATALLFIGRTPTRPASGTLRLNGVPTFETVMMLADKSGDTSDSAAAMVTQASPYADASYFVEIRWVVTRIRPETYLFTTQATIVDGSGSPLVPAHVVEPTTSAIVDGGTIRFLGEPKAL